MENTKNIKKENTKNALTLAQLNKGGLTAAFSTKTVKTLDDAVVIIKAAQAVSNITSLSSCRACYLVRSKELFSPDYKSYLAWFSAEIATDEKSKASANRWAQVGEYVNDNLRTIFYRKEHKTDFSYTKIAEMIRLARKDPKDDTPDIDGLQKLIDDKMITPIMSVAKIVDVLKKIYQPKKADEKSADEKESEKAENAKKDVAENEPTEYTFKDDIINNILSKIDELDIKDGDNIEITITINGTIYTL